MDNRTFKVAGISTDPKGSTKIRFANDYVGRIKILNMRKHTDIKLVELEKPMSKKEICDFLLGHADFQNRSCPDGDHFIREEKHRIWHTCD